MGQVTHPVLLSKLFVSFFCLIDLDTLQLGILSLLLEQLDLLLSEIIESLLLGFLLGVVDAIASPGAPALLDSGSLYRLPDLINDLFIFFLLKLIISLIHLSDKQ